MANPYLSTLSVAVAGTGSSENLVAGVAGESTRIWQLVFSGTANDTLSLVWKVAGTQTTLKASILANTTLVLPMTGAPWAQADVALNITFTAASTSTVTAYYTQAQGG